MSSLALSNAEILRSIAVVAGVNRAANEWDETFLSDARDVIRSGLRRFFNPLDFTGQPHQWRFLDRTLFVYGQSSTSAGSVSIVNGVASLLEANWPIYAADCVLIVNGTVCFVTTRVDDETLTITDTNIIASNASYTLVRWRFPFPEDFTEITDRRVVFSAGTNHGNLLRTTSVQEIRTRWTTAQQQGDPNVCAIVPGVPGTDASDMYLAVWPALTSGSSLTCSYRSHPGDNLNVSDLTADGELIQVPAVHAETLKAAIQASAEDYFYDAPAAHTARFVERLAASIKYDRHASGQWQVDNPDPRIDPRAMALLKHVPIYEV